MDDGLLTDDRIDELLLHAEARLEALASMQDSSPSSVSGISRALPLRYE